jgi:hypothetical protein
MKLRAKIDLVLNKTRHWLVEEGRSIAEPTLLPPPVEVEILETKDGVFLFYLDTSGECLADGWHASIAEAKQQAQFEFGIADKAWQLVPEG